MKIKSPLVHISVMMLNRNGLNNSKSTFKYSMPIPIPVSKKLVVDTLEIYDKYDNSIPKYGSAEQNSNSILSQKKNNLYNKCSESSNFPNQPFGKSPPDKRYMTSIYLNMVANNNLRRSFVEG